MTTTLLLTTYNWTDALNLVLKSIKRQSKMPDVIVIADDGSRQDTKELIDSFRAQIKAPIHHIWQKDDGFRKTKILNKAFKQIDTDYIIQIDGDVILHKHFVKDHFNNAEKDMFLFGSRVSITEDLSKQVIAKQNINIKWFNKGLLRGKRALRITALTKISKQKGKNSSKLRGCNMSFWLADAIAINGYNEDFIGWGYEDYNFAQRLINNGVLAKRLKQTAIQFHIYHNEAPKGDTTIGDNIQNKTMKDKETVCKNGIEKL